MKSISVSRQFAPLRAAADICFYIYFIALLSFTVAYNASGDKGVYGVITNVIAPWSVQVAVFVLASFVLGFLIVRIDSAPLRCVLSLIPGIPFFTAKFEPSMLFVLAAWAYYVIYMTAGSFEVYIDVYRRRMRVMLIVAFVLTGFLIVFRFANDLWYGSKLLGGELYGLYFFVLTVVSLRGMRLSTGSTGKMRALDIGFVVAVPVIFTASIFLFGGMVPVITFLVKYFMRFLAWIKQLLFGGGDDTNYYNTVNEAENIAEESPLDQKDIADDNPIKEIIRGKNPVFHISQSVVTFVLAAIIVAVLVYIAVKLVKNRGEVSGKPKRTTENIQRVPYEKPRRRGAAELAGSSNATQVRKTYRAYLAHLKSRNVQLQPSDTSREVLLRSSKYLDVPENAALRDLYIAARYGDPCAVTPEQAGEAKRCLAGFKEAEKTL